MKQLDPKAVWLFFLGSIWRLLFYIIILSIFWTSVFIGNRNNITTDPSFGFLNWSWLVFLAFLVFCWIVAKLTYKFYKYELREDSFRKEHGIIWKKYVSIPYDRIQNVDIYRGVFARLLGLSDIQIQTAGGITAGSYGAFSEGRLLGLSREVAEQLRDELIQRARQSKNQGL